MESGGLHKDAVQLCRHGALEYQKPQSAHETAQKNEETSASSEQVRKLGRSIEERPKEVEERKEFGHWECDLVIGAKSGQDEALLTLLERKIREFMIVKLPDKSAKALLPSKRSWMNTANTSERFSKQLRRTMVQSLQTFQTLKRLQTLYTIRSPTH